jgi:Xaa-Pro aminopeptidase
MTELETKRKRISELLARHNLDALLLRRVSSVAWVTGGAASYVNLATTDGASSLLITPSGSYVICNNIEATRLEQEEKLGALGWQFRSAPWHGANDAVEQLTRGLKLGADGAYPGAMDLSGEIARLRAALVPEEGERLIALGRLAAEGMNATIRAVRPGQTEYEIAAALGASVQSQGAQPIVNLIATDDRIFKFRHPLPTGKRLEHYAMLVLCARKQGLVCSITRLVHFGRVPDPIRQKTLACARVDAAMIDATRAGATLDQVVQRAIETYAATGFPGEWQLHHQGGPAGDEPREYLGTPGSTDVVANGQAYAWNPSITGTKFEDTILVAPGGNRVITEIQGWPVLSIPLADGRAIARPDILEIT